MDFLSLHLQRDCAMSVTNAGALMTVHAFYSYYLDLHPMTLSYKVNLNILKTYLHTKNELGQGFQQLWHYRQTDGHTHRHIDRRDRTHCHAAFDRRW